MKRINIPDGLFLEFNTKHFWHSTQRLDSFLSILQEPSRPLKIVDRDLPSAHHCFDLISNKQAVCGVANSGDGEGKGIHLKEKALTPKTGQEKKGHCHFSETPF